VRRLPNAERAEIDLRKLSDYGLHPDHLRGRHKGRVFKAILGLERRHADWLAGAIRRTLATAPAKPEESDRWGARWRTDHAIERHGRRATVRCLWLLPAREDAPRLISCYVRR